jgi:hypothetical protein
MAYAAASLHTAITDMLGHRGYRRARWHDALSVALGVAIGLYLGNAAAGLAMGLIHVVLDWISPGRLAVSWLYNAPFFIMGVALNLYISRVILGHA